MTSSAHPASAGRFQATDTDFVSTITFESPIDRVVSALTDPAGLSRWWVPASGSGLQGGELTFLFPVEKLVVRVDEANRSLVRWTPLVCEPLPDWVGTSITFTLRETEEGGSQMVFRHAGLAQLECFELCRKGWEHYLPRLVDYVDAEPAN